MNEEDRHTRITLRIPKEMHNRLVASAYERSHSMNAEILRRIDLSFSVEEDNIGKLSEWAVKVHKEDLEAATKKVELTAKNMESFVIDLKNLVGRLKKEG